MKRLFSLLLALSLCLSFAACKPASQPVELDLEAEAAAIMESYGLTSGKYYSSLSQEEGEYLDEVLITAYYGDGVAIPSFEEVEAYAVYIDESKPVLPCEFGIFKMKPDADTELFMSFLQARIDGKLLNAQAYPSVDTEALSTAKVSCENGYVWYCVVKGGNAEIDKALSGKLK